VTLFLLRHGQTDWNLEPARCQGWAETPLNDVGRAQARERGRELRGRGIELVVTSHLARALETAVIVRAELSSPAPATAAASYGGAAGPHGAPGLVVDPRLAETRRGRWEGRRFSEILRDEPERWRAYRERPETFRFPGGESLVEQQRRALAALRDVALDGRTTLVVTHGGTIRLMRCFFEGRGIAAFHETATANGGVDELDIPDLAVRVDSLLAGEPAAGPRRR
jgi:broad specificity phosphatase PhoE